jgi:hypothetical protein
MRAFSLLSGVHNDLGWTPRHRRQRRDHVARCDDEPLPVRGAVRTAARDGSIPVAPIAARGPGSAAPKARTLRADRLLTRSASMSRARGWSVAAASVASQGSDPGSSTPSARCAPTYAFEPDGGGRVGRRPFCRNARAHPIAAVTSWSFENAIESIAPTIRASRTRPAWLRLAARTRLVGMFLHAR